MPEQEPPHFGSPVVPEDRCTCDEDRRDESCPFHSPGSMSQPKAPGVAKVKMELDTIDFHEVLTKAGEAMMEIEKAFRLLRQEISATSVELTKLRDQWNEEKLP